MNTQAWGFLAALAAVYFFMAAMCRAAAKELPTPPKELLVKYSWRVTESEGLPATVSLYLSPEVEKLFAREER